MVIEPLGLAQDMSYPVLARTYSGPGRAVGPRCLECVAVTFQFLAQQGFFILQVNVRTAAGERRLQHREVLPAVRIQELMDLEDAVSWLLEKYPQADASRVASTAGATAASWRRSHSHTAICSSSHRGRRVYDWRLYDTIYTKQYMDTPQNNPEGCKNTS